MTGLLVTQKKGFSAGVDNRIVVPRSETKLVGILAPGVAERALAHYGAEVGIGDHIGPGRRCGFARLQSDDIFPAIRGVATDAVVACDRFGHCMVGSLPGQDWQLRVRPPIRAIDTMRIGSHWQWRDR